MKYCSCQQTNNRQGHEGSRSELARWVLHLQGKTLPEKSGKVRKLWTEMSKPISNWWIWAWEENVACSEKFHEFQCNYIIILVAFFPRSVVYLLRERRTSIAWRATLFVEPASAPKNKVLFADLCTAYQACLYIYCETRLKQISSMYMIIDHWSYHEIFFVLVTSFL